MASSRETLRRHGALLFAAFLFADVAVAAAACSTSSPDADGADATTTETGGGDAAKDSPVAKPDGAVDAGKVGNCSPAKGACDIVLQDCPAQQECVVNAAGGTECSPVQPSQQLPIGRGCCPNNAAGNPCLPGLT